MTNKNPLRHVWIRPSESSEFQVPWAAVVLSESRNKLKVHNYEGKEVTVSSKQILGPVSSSDVELFNDMIQLSDLQEYSVLRNLVLRYYKNEIYTTIGGIMIAMNPYTTLPIYTDHYLNAYKSKRMGELSPHIFALGAQALNNVLGETTNQAIVVSGESGAGKTESTKLLLNFLNGACKQTIIGQQIIYANPIIEAFGNAKTTKNDNSSRFGKYIEISFGSNGTMTKATVHHYLLELSRVKSQNSGDRNYHVFYSMLEGMSLIEKNKYELTTARKYFYLNQGNATVASSRDEKQEWIQLIDSMSRLNFTSADQEKIFAVLACILHLGNLSFRCTISGNDEVIELIENEHFGKLCSILGVFSEDLKNTLTHRTITVERNLVVSNMSIGQAIAKRDSLAIALYSRLFSFILTTINKSISEELCSSCPTIGILDIFGFENYSFNSFEQLCINYANERLQQHFVQHVFKAEQEEYAQEGIAWEYLSYRDNYPVVELLGARSSPCILSLIDEQSNLPQGSDLSFLIQVNQTLGSHPNYVKAKSEMTMEFGVKHFASLVTYNVQGFVEKNTYRLGSDWLNLMKNSSNPFTKSLFAKELTSIKSTAETQSMQFRKSLNILMSLLSSRETFFVRCIKPNNNKQSMKIDYELLVQQLRYSGMMETTRIRQLGYPFRATYEQFIRKYRILLSPLLPLSKIVDFKKSTMDICSKYLTHEEYALGRTKVFLKVHSDSLELMKERKLSEKAVVIQKHVRGYIARKRFEAMKRAALVIQRHWRSRKPRSELLIIRHGFLRLQSRIRSRMNQRDFMKLKSTIIRFQARCRGFLIRRMGRRKTSARQELSPSSRPIPYGLPTETPTASQIDNWITTVFAKAVQEKYTLKPVNKSLEPDDSKYFTSETPIPFPKFAAANFTGNVSYRYTNKLLKQPLLEHQYATDQLAALALWATILRFMGDHWSHEVFKKKHHSDKGKNKDKNVRFLMGKLQSTVTNTILNSKEYLETLSTLKEEECLINRLLETGPFKLVDLTMAHRRKLENEKKRMNMEITQLKQYYASWVNDGMTHASFLDLVYFIIGHGIFRPQLRDEIYCQVCKQLTKNDNPKTIQSGWVLFRLIVASFPPSARLAPTILHFALSSSGNPFDCVRPLKRTLDNGPRSEPPTAFELQALKDLKPLVVTVTLADGTAMSMELDSASTAKEVVQRVSKEVKLKDSFGFDLFITMFNKKLPVNGHVMDSVSKCETEAQCRGFPPLEAPWKLHFLKQFFTPWCMYADDPTEINLIYSQIIQGSSSGEYRCTQEGELALLVAQHYFITCGDRVLPEILGNFIGEAIPMPLLKQKGSTYWLSLITDTIKKSYFHKLRIPEWDVKLDVVEYAKQKWPLLFSKYFVVNQTSGLRFEASSLVLALNSEGIFVAENSMKILTKFSFLDIASIESKQLNNESQSLDLKTRRNYRFTFEGPDLFELTYLVKFIINGLKRRTLYAVAVQNYVAPEQNFLSLEIGDLVIFQNGSAEGISSKGWCKGYNVENDNFGEFPQSTIELLPCVNRPPKYILDSFKMTQRDSHRPNKLVLSRHTLESYASRFFRSSNDIRPSNNSKKAHQNYELWEHSSTLLLEPLHRSLGSHSRVAVSMFTAIYRYSEGHRDGVKHNTRAIFEPPLAETALRDELYCQIMKQLTNNPSSKSQEKLWELMYLAVSLFSPSSILLEHLTLFLETRTTLKSRESLLTLEKIIEKGDRRISHHWIEIEAVQQETRPCQHKVCFPNGMEYVFNVEPHTVVGDFILFIGRHLGFNSTEGFSLAIDFRGDFIHLQSDSYLFDAILEACNFPHSAKDNETPRYLYNLMFVKKLWINIHPGVDHTADVVCHYDQEITNYLAGKHVCSFKDVISLGALLYIVEIRQSNNFKSPLKKSELQRALQRIIPRFLLDELSDEEWIDNILADYAEFALLDFNEAKIKALTLMKNWPSFGSTFFDLHKSTSFSDASFTLAVNRRGLYIYKPYSEEPVIFYGYNQIITIENKLFSVKITLLDGTTTWNSRQAKLIVDLVKSYIICFENRLN